MEKIYLSSVKEKKLKLALACKVSNTLYFLTKYYQNFNNWYWNKVFPGLFLGNREIIIYKKKDKIFAICILKNTIQEQKISTIYVDPIISNQGFGSKILLDSFTYLGTNKPTITLPKCKFFMLNPFLEKFHFTFSYAKNIYNRSNNPEYFYNYK